MKTILILVLLGLQVGLCAQKHFEIKVVFEAGSPGITPHFKVDVKNVTDSTLFIVNSSEYWGEGPFNPKNSYFVVDYVLNNGQSGVISGIPLMINKDKHVIKMDANQSIENKFWIQQDPGFHGFSGIFPSDFDLSKVVKVRFRLVKLFYGIKYGIKLGSGPYSDAEYSSNWVTLKGL